MKLNDPEYFVKCCSHLDNPETDNECDFSMIYYPPIYSDTVLPPETIRCAEHTDYEILTLLFQNEVGGLEVLHNIINDMNVYPTLYFFASKPD